ncbi:hypothetical protein ES705_30994 [subsurface metagenome]
MEGYSLREEVALVLTVASLSIAVASIFLSMVILWWPLAQFGMVMFCFFILFLAVFMTVGRKKSGVKMKPFTFGEFLAINLLFFRLVFCCSSYFFPCTYYFIGCWCCGNDFVLCYLLGCCNCCFNEERINKKGQRGI